MNYPLAITASVGCICATAVIIVWMFLTFGDSNDDNYDDYNDHNDHDNESEG